MPRRARETSLALGPRPATATLRGWLYDELRGAILDGRLSRGARLPATRDLAARYRVSRGVVVGVFAQLGDEGYVESRVGSGTVVRLSVPDDQDSGAARPAPPRARPQGAEPSRPFFPFDVAVDDTTLRIWARLAGRVLGRISARTLGRGTPAGSLSLRQAVAGYLGAARGVACSPDHVVILSGVQQGLDLIARLVIRPGDPVWIEDPGYSGAVDAFRNARARIVPVRVDDDGLDPADGHRRCQRPAAVYLTPAHQFCLGSPLSLERRLELLRWARAAGVVLVEDDYDSEFRFSGRPLPAMKGLDGGDSVFLLGTFNKALFPSLRLGYMVAPDAWIDRILALRYQTDLYPPALAQAVLTAFIDEGHFARHLRRMRERYALRLGALQREIERSLGGVVRLPAIEAGLSTPVHLARPVSARRLVEEGKVAGLDLWSLDRYALERRDLHGLLLGFAAFSERRIREGVHALASCLPRRIT